MKIFIDTASIKEIKEASALGLIDGVTTNPTLMSKEGRNPEEVLKEICNLCTGPVSAEVISPDAKGMVEEAGSLVNIAKNIVIKVPLNKEGLKAVRIFSAEGVKTNVTLCFSAAQALLVAKAGATYVSPFIGRLDDIAQEGMDLIRDIKKIYSNYNFSTQIIVASVRNPMHVVNAALAGADIATVPFSVIEQLIKHPLTDIGINKFLEDFKKIPKGNNVK
ncbi:MAG: fructose-6-phosphate aldolase [Candidatus Omnitrophica bacterium]|jgi:transaldolase|nr:fructose-6-phosphate aldolase [Candidatus Omnitrophota bacterium]MDD5661111.1 fructose-6-phosphate aldolase [Candidatus Omnitrophota bacterium]